MTENLPSIDLSEAGNEILKNALSKPAKSTGGILSTTLDFIHNTLFLPMQRYNLYAEAKLNNFKSALNSSIDQIPKEKLVESSVNILGPTVEGLKYNLDEEHIKKMFMDILLADMNTDTKSKVLPAYIEIVKQLSVKDVAFLEILFHYKHVDIYDIQNHLTFGANHEIIKLVAPDLSEKGVRGMSNLLSIYITGDTMNELDKIVIDNLERLKIVEISDKIYNFSPKNRQEIFNKIKYKYDLKDNLAGEPKMEIKYTCKCLEFTTLGSNFADICLK